MHYLDFIRGVHDLLSPRTYLEVGVGNGASLALSTCDSIGIDPAVALTQELAAPTELFQMTSDDYFESIAPNGPFADRPIDLAFIDGMHLFEYAMRDFVNIERHTEWSSVTIIDDVLPHGSVEAARERTTVSWTGDIFKVPLILKEARPDLIAITVETDPTGLLVVFGLDPSSTVLNDRLGEFRRRYLTPDPQVIPPAVLARSGALDPEAVLALPVWDLIRAGRSSNSAAVGRDQIRRSFPGTGSKRAGGFVRRLQRRR
jgi:hypothetical protein